MIPSHAMIPSSQLVSELEIPNTQRSFPKKTHLLSNCNSNLCFCMSFSKMDCWLTEYGNMINGTGKLYRHRV